MTRARRDAPRGGGGRHEASSPRPLFLALALALALLAAACGGERNAARGEPAAAADVPHFDGDSAHALIKQQVAFGPRVPGTEGHRKQLEWMTNYLRSLADTVEVQRFTHVMPGGDTLPLANVFARFRPDAADRVLLVAHWDTRPISDQDTGSFRAMPIQGANDGGSGVAVLMQLADVLSSHSPPIGVDLLFTDGEDYATLEQPSADMYLGAEWFAQHKPPGYQPLYGVLVDMVGDESPRFPPEANSERMAPEVVERVWSTAEQLGYGDTFPRTGGISVTDDHLKLNDAGIRTADIIDLDYGPGNAYWHTHEDT